MSYNNDEAIPLSQLGQTLRELTGQEPPPYRRLHLLVLDGIIPARMVNKRWQIELGDLPEIARAIDRIRIFGPPFRRARARPNEGGPDLGDLWVE